MKPLRDKRMVRQPPEINKGTAYLLWALAFVMPIHGLHRFYAGKPVSGTLYFFTLGFFYIGQILDVFFISSMVDQRNRHFLEKARNDALIGFVSQSMTDSFPTSTPPKNKSVSDEPMIQLLQTASENKNVLSLGQAMISLQMSQDKVEELLKQAIRKGLAHVDNDPESGAVRYYFDI